MIFASFGDISDGEVILILLIILTPLFLVSLLVLWILYRLAEWIERKMDGPRGEGSEM